MTLLKKLNRKVQHWVVEMHALSQYSYTTPELGQQQIFRKNWCILKQGIKKLRSKYKMERNKNDQVYKKIAAQR